MPDFSNTLLTIIVLVGIGTLCGWAFRVYHKLRIRRLLSCLGFLNRDPETLSLITYKQAMQYFVTDRPAEDQIKHGAILLEAHNEGYLFTHVFLDAKYELVLKHSGAPYGRQVVAKELDADLKKAFARKKTFDGKKVLFVSGVSRLLEAASDVPIMTYADAMQFFSTHAPRNGASKGAMLLKRGIRKHIFQQVFLDEQGDLLCAPGGKPYGRQCFIINLDETLIKLFGDRNVLIVEESKTQEPLPPARTSQEPLPDLPGVQTETAHGTALTNQTRIVSDAKAVLSRTPRVTKEASEAPASFPSPTTEATILTYKAALTYFVTERPTDSRIKKGAIRLAKHRQGYIVDQVFLDARSEPVRGSRGELYGRSLIVKDLDQELWETFDGKQLIIVE